MSAVATAALRTSTYAQLLGNGTLVVAGVYLVLFGIFVAGERDALTVSGMTDLFNNALPLALAAAGGTLVVLTRGFDLSVAGVVALTNVLVATSIGDGTWAPLRGLLMVMAVGLAVGAVNGLLVAYVGLQSVACTLATMIICSGLALLVLDAPGGEVPDFIAEGLTGTVGGLVPVAALIAAAVILFWMAIRRTDWGVALYAVGADETAATSAGIPTRRIKLSAFCLAGVFYGLTGYMLSAVTATGNPTAGNSYLLHVFAAIAIGGVSFSGGRGGVLGAMIGAATLSLLHKALFSVGISSFYTGIFEGLIMILAVLVGALSERIAHGSRT